ncbi:hypothetical protein KIPB_007952 [Kipferlia bialata]|uniref:Secreted protein n=1 Tax=Kipferlia bialata TaxID=797122 RepID=A0A391NN97_9EUKA|nr:hypothetical protein KIPB_006693 [Kipferlia bialata]GCA63115.1 hypothetical protein KIPB_007952 [Kipferlia bialata]|eukprot:g6693.t1
MTSLILILTLTLDDSLDAEDTHEAVGVDTDAGIVGGSHTTDVGAGATGAKPPLPTPLSATGLAAAVSPLSDTAAADAATSAL